MTTFREALLSTLEERGISLRAVAEGANVSYEQLKKLKQNKSRSTNVDDAARIADFLGLSLSELLHGEVGQDHVDLANVLSRLEPEYRQFLLNAARAQLDRDPKSE